VPSQPRLPRLEGSDVGVRLPVAAAKAKSLVALLLWCGHRLGYDGPARLHDSHDDSLAEDIVITPGTYTVSFKTPVREGAGMVDFTADGKLCGGRPHVCLQRELDPEGRAVQSCLVRQEGRVRTTGRVRDDGSDRHRRGRTIRWRPIRHMRGLRKAIAGTEVGGRARPH
jgi:hypothetical protein